MSKSNIWQSIYEEARKRGVTHDEAMAIANVITDTKPASPVPVPKGARVKPVAVATPWPSPKSVVPAGAALPVSQTPDVPDWIKARQVHAANALDFQPPKREKALPLDPDQISDALAEHWLVIEARELDGLDVWFVLATKVSKFGYYQIILYEFKGDWLCSSITELPMNTVWDLASGPDRTSLFTGHFDRDWDNERYQK